MKVYKSYKTAKRQPQSVNSEASTTEGVNHAVPWGQKKSLTSEAFL